MSRNLQSSVYPTVRRAGLLAVLFLTSPLLALATSGACSGHGGVSCSAGPDSDGSAICNDGWRNSSVRYSSMVKCAEYHQTQRVPAVTKVLPANMSNGLSQNRWASVFSWLFK